LLGDGVCTGLKQYGYTVDWLKDGEQANLATKMEKFDVIILDIGLPKVSGLEFLETIRNRGNVTPVLILTARETIEDRVRGLDSGADDYLTKPFDLDELCARLRALQRRFADRATPIVQYGQISLDPASHIVYIKDQIISIPRREFVLLQKLLENNGRVLSREYLTQTLYGWEEEIDSNTLEVHIHNLRKKLGSKLIRTIRGVGYMVDKEKT